MTSIIATLRPMKLHFLAAVREAERDIEQDRVVTNEQMKARIDEWTAS